MKNKTIKYSKEFNKLLKQYDNKSKMLSDYMNGTIKLSSKELDRVMELRPKEEIGRGGCRVGRRLENEN